jgi:hypothetical protein
LRMAIKMCLAVYCDAPSARVLKQKGRERVKGGDLAMAELVWQEMGILLASGAIGSLLTWGYQNWLKR